MYYGEIKNCDIANGLGVRVSLFVSGCRNACKNCFNQKTWNFLFGHEFTREVKDKLLNMLSQSYIAGLTILGGEPLEPENQEEILKFMKEVKEKNPNKTIWMYTGFTYEEITSDSNCRANTKFIPEILKYLDVLVDGRFVEEFKDIKLKFRGSSNQRLIDAKKTLKENKVILYDL